MKRSLEIARYGGPEVLRVRWDPVPNPERGEIRIDVAYAGVNFADAVMRRGMYQAAPHPPFVPGFEVAGLVSAVGRGVTGFREGDRVFAGTRFGGYTSHLVVPAGQARPVPEGVGLAEAAGVPAVYATAWLGITSVAHARAGETMLVHAVAGGVGTAAVQIGKHLGLRVLGTASTDAKLSFAREQGLDVGINYAHRDFLEAVLEETNGRGVDVCLDSVGGAILDRSYRCLAPGGRLVLIGAADLWPSSPLGWLRSAYEAVTMRRFSPFELIGDNKTVGGLQVLHLWDEIGDEGGTLDVLADLLARGVLRPVVDREFPLERAVDAHDYLERRKARGKVVLRVSGGAPEETDRERT